MSHQPSSKVRQFVVLAAAVLCLPAVPVAAGQAVPSQIPTFSATSRLVFLDVTVLDRKGNPVATELTKDDFTITEDKRKQRIFSFEAPQSHVAKSNPVNPMSIGETPVAIFVLDLLNSRFEDFAHIRFEVRKYLAAQPLQLNSPAALMVLGNESLEMVQGLTVEIERICWMFLKHVRNAVPYKDMSGAFWAERFGQSIDALQQIALQNKGIPGRKNVIWGGPWRPWHLHPLFFRFDSGQTKRICT